MTKKYKQESVAGIDVSARELHVQLNDAKEVKVFENSTEGHREVVAYVRQRAKVRVVLEATGTYHLDIALALAGAKRCRVSVVNPRAAKHFHQAQNIRAKTDRVDALSLYNYALRMDFVPWLKPSAPALELRGLVRYQEQMVKDQARLKAQIHAAGVSQTTGAWLTKALAERLETIALQLQAVGTEFANFENRQPEIEARIQQSVSIPGIGRLTARRLVASYLLLDPTMTSSQITAWAGLDPRAFESGSSIKGRRPISKRGSGVIRGNLFLCALTAARKDGPLRDFYLRITERSKFKHIGTIAVMRKLLIISWAMYRTNTSWDSQKAAPRIKKVEQAA